MLAAVTIGVYMGWYTPQLTDSLTRLSGDAFWEIFTFVVNALLFALVGLQLRGIVDRVGDPILAALLLGKAAAASEHGVKLDVHAAQLPNELEDVRSLVAMLGNLIDNALESASGGKAGGHVDVTLHVEGGELVIAIHDSGPGVDPSLTREIFLDGFTTKVARDGQRKRGLGLALVSQEVRRRGGTIAVENVDGARFVVRLPLRTLEEAPS